MEEIHNYIPVNELKDTDFDDIKRPVTTDFEPYIADAFSIVLDSMEVYETMPLERRRKYVGWIKKLFMDNRFGKEFLYYIHNSYGGKKIFRGQYEFSPFDPVNLMHVEAEIEPERGPERDHLHFNIYVGIAHKNYVKGKSLGINVDKINTLFKACFGQKCSMKIGVEHNASLQMRKYGDKDKRAAAEQQGRALTLESLEA